MYICWPFDSAALCTTLAFTPKIVARVDCQRWAYWVWDAHLQLDEFSIIASHKPRHHYHCKNVLSPGWSY